MVRACCALLVFVVVVLPQRGARVEAIPKWLTFYGDDPDNQHEWSNLGTSGITGIKGIQPPTLPPLPPAHHPTLPRPRIHPGRRADSWDRYRRRGLLHVSGWARYPDWPTHCHENASYGCPVGGLTPDWQAVVGRELDWAMPLIRNGTIAGLFLGDEPCCMGVPVWALETVAAFCKKKTAGTGAFVYGA